ncbi:scaffolding protein [Gordonia phage BBQValindra]|nr:scaffolding protein [Gordonia phage BBQValindra]
MAEHTPIHKPGDAITRTASADITGGQLVVVSGNNTVAPSAGASAAWLGIAAFDAKSGEKVTILRGGIHELNASGAIAAGAAVIPAAAGAVATIGSETNYASVVGVALAAAASNKVIVSVR